jgi:hypothetical protein
MASLALVLVLWILGVACPLAGGIYLIKAPIEYIDSVNSYLAGGACRVEWLVVNHTAMFVEVNVVIEKSEVPSAIGKDVTIYPPCGIIYCTGGQLIGLKEAYQPGTVFGCLVCECAFAKNASDPGCFCIDDVAVQPYGYSVPDYIGGAGLVLFSVLVSIVAVWYSLDNASRLTCPPWTPVLFGAVKSICVRSTSPCCAPEACCGSA